MPGQQPRHSRQPKQKVIGTSGIGLSVADSLWGILKRPGSVGGFKGRAQEAR